MFVDADQDGKFEHQTEVGDDGISSLAFDFHPIAKTKESKLFGRISMFLQSADGLRQSEQMTLAAVQVSTENPAKAVPINCAADGDGNLLEPRICTCNACSENTTLFSSSPEGFAQSNTPEYYGVETATGKFRSAFPVTSFATRKLGFSSNMHYASMVKYDGPVGQSFSYGFNMMIVQSDEFNGQIVTPDLRF